jgi:hypothetical protein
MVKLENDNFYHHHQQQQQTKQINPQDRSLFNYDNTK